MVPQQGIVKRPARRAADDPIGRFRRWIALARARGAPLVEAVALATSGARGRPSVRFVLLKQVDEDGFVFFTDARSRKGRDLAANPHGALAFYWEAIRRQVRVEGPIEQVSPEEADAYWATRPRASRLAGSISRQSAPIPSRAALLLRYRRLRARLRGRRVPRPPWWTGFRLRPEAIEFWIHRGHRLHDRELFERRGGRWRRSRLQP